MGKFDVVMKNFAGSLIEPYMAENDWGILISSIVLCDRLCLDVEMKRWHLGVNGDIKLSIFTELHYVYNVEEIKRFPIKNAVNDEKSLEESLMDITSLLCPYASLRTEFIEGKYDDISFQVEMCSQERPYVDKVLERMKILKLPIVRGGSNRSKLFGTALNYIRYLHKNSKSEKLNEIANNVRKIMLQLTTFMKLMQKYEKDEKFKWAIGYIATSVAMMNYLTFGNNEGEELFANCLRDDSHSLTSEPIAIMMDKMPRISKFVYNIRKISPMMFDLICHKDGKDIALTNKLCEKYSQSFICDDTFSSRAIDITLDKDYIDESDDSIGRDSNCE